MASSPVIDRSLPDARPAWQYAAERRLGRIARQLAGPAAEAEIPVALVALELSDVLAATREDSWALACLRRAAVLNDGSLEQGAWVLLAACRPRLVRDAIHGPRPDVERRRARRARIAARQAAQLPDLAA